MLGPLLLALTTWFGVEDTESVGATSPPSAKAALQSASQTKRSSHGKKGEEKHAVLKQAAAEYEAVAKQYQGTPAAEAWFRAGEIHRTLRQVERASHCFSQAAGQRDSTEFAARACNELGHLERRTKNYDSALQHYENVEKEFPDQRKEGIRSLTWRGKVLLLQEKTDAATELLLSVRTRYPEFPVEAVRNVDLVATTWIKAGRLSEARQLVQECLESLGTPPEGQSEVDAEVQRALDRMKATEQLEAASSDLSQN